MIRFGESVDYEGFTRVRIKNTYGRKYLGNVARFVRRRPSRRATRARMSVRSGLVAPRAVASLSRAQVAPRADERLVLQRDVGVALELGVLGNLPEHHRGRGEVRAVRVHLFRDKKKGDGRRATRETILVRRRERGFASRRVASVVFFASQYYDSTT